MNHRILLITVDRETGDEVLLSRRLFTPEDVDRHLGVIAEFIDLNRDELEGLDCAIVIENSRERIWNAQPGRRF